MPSCRGSDRRRPLAALAVALVALVSACTAANASDLSAPRPTVSTAPSAPAVLSPSPSGAASASARPVPSQSPSKPRPKPTLKPTAKPPSNLAARLRTLPAGTTQVVIVHAPSAGTTHATLETFRKVGGAWVRKFAAMPARIGQNGLTTHHVEGVPNTPTGVFGFGSTIYGIGADPGVHYAYHHLVTDDWWDENPLSAHYNQFVHGSDPGGGSEALWKIRPQYEFFAFITYNSPPTGSARGSAVFLHVTDNQSTLGCVSLPRGDLLDVLRWLDPHANPRIVIGTDAQLSHF
jgi:L,D-peptidoglycan transpeptidase YkuD (ErfK/YbiS/YcfS/YnhG family)